MRILFTIKETNKIIFNKIKTIFKLLIFLKENCLNIIKTNNHNLNIINLNDIKSKFPIKL